MGMSDEFGELSLRPLREIPCQRDFLFHAEGAEEARRTQRKKWSEWE